jgi:hypothetical protein
MGSTQAHHQQEGWNAQINCRLEGIKQMDQAKTVSYSQDPRDAGKTSGFHVRIILGLKHGILVPPN